MTSKKAAGKTPKVVFNSRDIDREFGPFDRSETDIEDGYLNFGCLYLRPNDEMQMQFEIDDDQNITAITMMMGDSAVQVQVFAAPKSTGIWDGIRAEISATINGAGGSTEEELTSFGIELQAAMPASGPDGRTTFTPARFLGIDGPRWFLRAVISGTAASDSETAAPIHKIIRDIIVDRGNEPRAPRELLEISLPREILDLAQEESTETSASPSPFERGPEITEVR